MSRTAHFPVHEDARGGLLPVELEDMPFTVRRIFVVTAPEGGADRGGHEVACRELVVLISGRAEIRVGPTSGQLSESVVLDRPGASVHLERGEFMVYRLADASSVVVLADEPYAHPSLPRLP